jgi:hypothetical protein
MSRRVATCYDTRDQGGTGPGRSRKRIRPGRPRTKLPSFRGDRDLPQKPPQRLSDGNPRSSGQFRGQPPDKGAAPVERSFGSCGEWWSRHSDLNRGPAVYENRRISRCWGDRSRLVLGPSRRASPLIRLTRVDSSRLPATTTGRLRSSLTELSTARRQGVWRVRCAAARARRAVAARGGPSAGGAHSRRTRAPSRRRARARSQKPTRRPGRPPP